MSEKVLSSRNSEMWLEDERFHRIKDAQTTVNQREKPKFIFISHTYMVCKTETNHYPTGEYIALLTV